MSLWSQPVRLLELFFRRKMRTLAVRDWPSAALGRPVDFDVYLPPDHGFARYRRYPLVLFNDGQDLPRMDFAARLETLWRKREIPYFVVVGVYAGAARMREYGTAHRPDYKGRGDRAGAYTAFILKELLPHLREKYRLSARREETAAAGFSLGGLSALDLAWSHSAVFGAAGAFSASLWWRALPVDPAEPDASRILHDLVRDTPPRPADQRFWFQCGTLDETEDRNRNGVIDSIDDTLHLIDALRARGYGDDQIRYLEIEGGEHTPATWGEAMGDFLRWATGYSQKTFSPSET